MLEYDSIAAICEAAEQQQIPISALVLSDQAEQMEISKETLYERMRDSLHDRGLRRERRYHGNLFKPCHGACGGGIGV